MCTPNHKHSTVFTGADRSMLGLMRRDKAQSRQSSGRPRMPVTLTLLKGGKHQWHLIRQRGKTESLQDWETPPGTLTKNPAAVINLTPLKELTYGSDGRLTHFLARSSHLSTLKSTCWYSPGATSSITSHTRRGPAESSSFPLSNILRSLYYLIRNSCMTRMVSQLAFEVNILQILQKRSHLTTLMC